MRWMNQRFRQSTTMQNSMVHDPAKRDYVINLATASAQDVPNHDQLRLQQPRTWTKRRRHPAPAGDWIRQFPEVRFRVYGHTDLVGSEAYNKALGLRRAKAVVAYPVQPRHRHRSRLEAVVSFGKTQPVIRHPRPRTQRNRRTVTEVTGFVQGNPTGPERQICRDHLARICQQCRPTAHLAERDPTRAHGWNHAGCFQARAAAPFGNKGPPHSAGF